MAIGGSVGKDNAEMFLILDGLSNSEAIPELMPVHLLGIADPSNVEQCVKYGIDTFGSWSLLLHKISFRVIEF
jgi:tRNA-guanine family transglycosylase